MKRRKNNCLIFKAIKGLNINIYMFPGKMGAKQYNGHYSILDVKLNYAAVCGGGDGGVLLCNLANLLFKTPKKFG